MYVGIRTAEQARFSLEYAVSVVILDGEVSLRHFDEAVIQSAQAQRLMKKVRVFVPPDLQSLESKRNRYGEVAVYLSNGTVLRHRATQIRGQPPLFLTEREVDKKFYDCVVPALGEAKAQTLLQSLRDIEGFPRVRDIFSRLWERP
ncbi:MAG: MmgE/PrpD family protein [Deltaproteobacteria bacterium]|nr:MmgE/PrpD family protein [Deltaproteobacteria bacterium]